MGVTALAQREGEFTAEDLPIALRTVRNALCTLLLLFKKDELNDLAERYVDLRNAIVNLNHSQQGDYQDDVENVVMKAQAAIDAAISIGQNYCI